VDECKPLPQVRHDILDFLAGVKRRVTHHHVPRPDGYRVPRQSLALRPRSVPGAPGLKYAVVDVASTGTLCGGRRSNPPVHNEVDGAWRAQVHYAMDDLAGTGTPRDG